MMPVAMDLDIDQVHRLSLDEYHQLIESGGFDEDARIELIDGLLVDMSPKTREHENANEWVARWLFESCDQTRFRVRVASALTLEPSEPEPDFAVIPRDAPQPYHPATAALVIEVSVSSVRYDLLVKSGVYARAGVPEYWVLDLDGRRAICHRDPRPDGFYRDVGEVPGDGRLIAASVELPPLDVGELLAAAHG
jgi:Uma2 family endonuclease